MSLSSNEKRILELIREGRNSNADFTDSIGISAPNANLLCEGMEQEGYITRKSWNGIERFNWLLTDKGAAELEPLSAEAERLLLEGGINMEQYKILAYCTKHAKVQGGELVRDIKSDAKNLVSNLCYLVDNGYLSEGGLIRRQVTITDKGLKTFKKFDGQIAY